MIGMLVLSDIPGMDYSMGWARTTTIWFTRTYLRMTAFLAVYVHTLPPTRHCRSPRPVGPRANPPLS